MAVSYKKVGKRQTAKAFISFQHAVTPGELFSVDFNLLLPIKIDRSMNMI